MSEAMEVEIELLIDDNVIELECEVENNEIEVDLEVEVISGSGDRLPYYKGETIVKPKPRKEQTLETANKSMRENVLVLEIPYTEVHNSNGTTVIIGGD